MLQEPVNFCCGNFRLELRNAPLSLRAEASGSQTNTTAFFSGTESRCLICVSSFLALMPSGPRPGHLRGRAHLGGPVSNVFLLQS